jgi:signal transduction histidine kinase
MEFNPYSIPPQISLIAIFTIGFLAYRHKPASPINRSFLFFCLSLCFWLLAFSLMYNSTDKKLSLTWARIGFLGNPFIPLTAYLFVHRLLAINPVPFFRSLLTFSLISITLFNNDLIYAGIKREFFGFYPIAGKLYFVYTLFFGIIFLYCTLLLFIYIRKASSSKNTHYYRQIKYVFLAFILGSTGCIDFIAKYPNHLYPFGWLSSLLFISLISYAILRYQIEENELLRQEVAKTEKLKTIATLASSLAHEIKNPLTSLKTFTEYLPQKQNDPEFMKKYQEIIPHEISRIDNLIHDLLAFSKPSSPEIKEIRPNNIIQNMLIMMEQRMKSSQIQTIIELNAATTIKADPNQLKQALFNLILNALDAMPKGGKLTIKTEEDSQFYIITIADTGVGIEQEDLKHIFDPFFTKKEKGTGLGLAITQRIIEKHGGKIDVESKINQGTIFTIQLFIGQY